MSREVRGGVSGERLHMLYDESEDRLNYCWIRWNLKEDPYITAAKSLEEAKKKPHSDSPVARALVEGLRLLLSSEGAPPRSVEGSSVEKSEKAATTQSASRQETNSQPSSPRPMWRLGDLLLRRGQQVPRKTSTTSSADSSTKLASSLEETYTEAYDEQGKFYHKRVAVEG